MTPHDVNILSSEDFIKAFGGVYEHAPWVAQRALAGRPFAHCAAMTEHFSHIVDEASVAEKRALVCSHPELGYRVGVDPALSASSEKEQEGAGLTRLSPEAYARLQELNSAYYEKFGMPCVICVRQVGKTSLFSLIERRLLNTSEDELAESLRQIHAIAALRIQDLVLS